MTNARHISLVAAAAGLLMLAGAAGAADQAIVTALFSSDAGPYHEVVQGFRGLLQGNDVPMLVYERMLAGETPESFSGHLAEKKPHVVLALGTRAAQFCRDNVKDVPVVFTMVLEADSLAGGNRTGVSLNIPARDRLASLRTILPSATHLGVVYSSASQSAQAELSRVAPQYSFSVVSRQISSQSEFPTVLSSLLPMVDCLVMVPDPTVYIPQSVEHLLRTAFEAQLPVVGLSSLYTRAGALVSFDCSYPDIGRQAATLTIRILDGEAPGGIQPLVPATLLYSLNMSVAKQLGINLPRSAVMGASALFGQ